MSNQAEFGGAFNGIPVIITGNTGFKGSWLSIWLKELGAHVIGYSLDPPTIPNNYGLCNLADEIIQVTGDIRDLAKLKETFLVHQPRVVIHMAAQPLVLAAYEMPRETFEINVSGTVNLMEVVRETPSVGVVIVVTTDKVYKDQKTDRLYVEEDILGGKDPYSASKAMVELLVQSYRESWSEPGFSNHPVAIATVRAGNVIGGGDFARFRLVPDSMKALTKADPIPLRHPDHVRPWQHVLEPLSGYLSLATKLIGGMPEFSEAWNFGPELEKVTTLTLARKLVELWGGSSEIEIQGDQSKSEGETFILRLSWQKAENRLRWRPTYSWEEAARGTVAWWQEYHQQSTSGKTPNMYSFCRSQIQRYVQAARRLGVAWANPTEKGVA